MKMNTVTRTKFGVYNTSNSLGQKFFKFQGNDGKEKRVEILEKEEQVDDKFVDIVQRLTSLLAKVVHYVHPSLFKPPWG